MIAPNFPANLVVLSSVDHVPGNQFTNVAQLEKQDIEAFPVSNPAFRDPIQSIARTSCTEQFEYGLTNTALLLDMHPDFYWSGTEYSPLSGSGRVPRAVRLGRGRRWREVALPEFALRQASKPLARGDVAVPARPQDCIALTRHPHPHGHGAHHANLRECAGGTALKARQESNMEPA